MFTRSAVRNFIASFLGEKVISNQLISLVAILLFMCNCNHLPKNVDSQINEIATTDYGRCFLTEHSFTNLRLVVEFIHEPPAYLEAVKDIQGICDYLSIYRRYFNEKAKAPSDFYDFFLRKHFATINIQKIQVLTFLLINCQKSALFSELLADVYANYFSSDPTLFICDLRMRAEWKAVVDALISASWPILESGLSKMGNSLFENEIREYVNSLRCIRM